MGKQPDVFPVIMCGGSGTRLWPVSRASRPKQFIPLVGPNSLFRQTVERVRKLSNFCELVVVAGERHADYIASDLADIDVVATLLLEPEGRDSAPAIAAATAYIERQNADGVMVVVASDHHIADDDVFQSDIEVAVQSAREGGIVTLGIAPTEPNTAYGYIRPGFTTGAVGVVEAFVEKPDVETARQYIAEGYLWNTGNFIAKAVTLTTAFAEQAGDIIEIVRDGLRGGREFPAGVVLGESFRRARKISFDHAIMESFQDRKVVRSAIKWSDLGAWDAVHAAQPHDDQGNSIVGDALLIDSRECHVRVAPGSAAVVAAVDGLNVAVEDDVVFVSRLDRSQDVKTVVEVLKENGRPELDVPNATFDAVAVAGRWRKWLETSALPLWWCHGFDHEKLLWRESLSPYDGRPTEQNPRARVQGRQTFVFARAGAMGWFGPGQSAVKAGCEAIQRHYCDDDGLLYTLADSHGKILDRTVTLYDQTFYLLALAAATNIVDQAEEKALRHLTAINMRFGRKDAGQGYCEAGTRPYQSNAHMHLFEAALTWTNAGGNESWRALAGDIANLAREKFIDAEGGFLREFFDANWMPAAGRDGQIIEPGHQFEWAWLLAQWAKIEDDYSWLELAKRLFASGIRGIDASRGVAVDQMDTSLRATTDNARLWPQTEWLKSAALLATLVSEDEAVLYENQATAAAKAVDRYLQTPIAGLWWDKMEADGNFVTEPAPASSLFHIIVAIEALCEWELKRNESVQSSTY